MAAIPEEDRAPDSTLVFNENPAELPSQKTLGVAWSPDEDVFMFKYHQPSETPLTKQCVLSRLSSLFDPRGQLAPYTIRGRVMFQELCIAGVGWDEVLTPEQASSWTTWFDEAEQLQEIKIGRCFGDYPDCLA